MRGVLSSAFFGGFLPNLPSKKDLITRSMMDLGKQFSVKILLMRITSEQLFQ